MLRIATLYSFLLALIAATCAAPTALVASRSLEKRDTPVNIAADAIVNAYVDLILNVCADVTADICLDAKVDLTLVAQGLVDANVNVDIPTLKAKVNAVVKATVDADVKALVNADVAVPLRAQVIAIIDGFCSNGDAACIRANAAAIVAKVNVYVIVLIKKLAVDLNVKIPADIPVNVKAKVHSFINVLNLEQLVIDGYAKLQADIKLRVNAKVKAYSPKPDTVVAAVLAAVH